LEKSRVAYAAAVSRAKALRRPAEQSAAPSIRTSVNAVSKTFAEVNQLRTGVQFQSTFNRTTRSSAPGLQLPTTTSTTLSQRCSAVKARLAARRIAAAEFFGSFQDLVEGDTNSKDDIASCIGPAFCQPFQQQYANVSVALKGTIGKRVTSNMKANKSHQIPADDGSSPKQHVHTTQSAALQLLHGTTQTHCHAPAAAAIENATTSKKMLEHSSMLSTSSDGVFLLRIGFPAKLFRPEGKTNVGPGTEVFGSCAICSVELPQTTNYAHFLATVRSAAGIPVEDVPRLSVKAIWENDLFEIDSNQKLHDAIARAEQSRSSLPAVLRVIVAAVSPHPIIFESKVAKQVVWPWGDESRVISKPPPPTSDSKQHPSLGLQPPSVVDEGLVEQVALAIEQTRFPQFVDAVEERLANRPNNETRLLDAVEVCLVNQSQDRLATTSSAFKASEGQVGDAERCEHVATPPSGESIISALEQMAGALIKMCNELKTTIEALRPPTYGTASDSWQAYCFPLQSPLPSSTPKSRPASPTQCSQTPIVRSRPSSPAVDSHLCVKEVVATGNPEDELLLDTDSSSDEFVLIDSCDDTTSVRSQPSNEQCGAVSVKSDSAICGDVTTKHVVACSATKASLPVGWEAKIAPCGRMYYIDHENESTTWTHPTKIEVSAA
jgi:hypothetical protein